MNTQCRMAARPVGLPTANDWSIVQQELPAAGDGEFVVEVDYLSIDPAMRVWMNAGDTYMPARKIDEVMRSMAIGTVVESRHDLFPRQTEHHPDTPKTTDPAGQPLAGSFHARNILTVNVTTVLILSAGQQAGSRLAR